MQAVIFDLGNVLVDYDHRRTIAAVASISDADEDEVAAIIGEAAHALNVGELSGAHLHQRLVRKAGTTTDLATFAAAWSAGIAPNATALDYALQLQELSGVTVAVISNTNDLHVAWLDANVPQLAAIDLVMMSNEVHLAKPDPLIFELAFELLDLAPAAVMMIDDIEENVAVARSLGLAGVVHTQWSTTRAELETWLAS